MKKSKNKKETLRIDLDFLNGPIWKDVYDPKTNESITGIPIIDGNKKLQELNEQILMLYSSLYEFDKGDKACSFNHEEAIKIKPKLLTLLDQLYDMINELNDGSFEVENRLDEEFWKIYSEAD